MKGLIGLAGLLLFSVAAEPDVSAGSSAGTVLVSTGSGQVLALHPRTGKIYWQTEFQPYRGHYYWVDTGIAWDKRAVYLADNTHVISAYAIRQGKRLWQAKLDVALDHAFIAADGADRLFVSGYNNGRLDCFDAKTGRVLWSSNELGLVHAERDLLIVGSITRNQLVRLDPATGREIWSAAGTPWYLGRSKDAVFCANWNGNTAAIHIKDGSQLWSVNRGSWKAATADDTLVLGGYFNHTTGVDAKSGRELWSIKHDRAHAQFVAALRGDCVFLRDVGQPTLYCLDLRTGEERFKVEIQAPASYLNGVSLAPGRAFIAGGLDQRVTCYGTAEKRELWMRRFKTSVHGVLAVDRTVVAATADELHGLRASDGSISWSFPCKTDGVFYARLIE